MATQTTPALRQYGAAVRAFLILSIILGLAYPLAMTGVAQAGFDGNADGSLVTRGGKTVGSDLIGQAFTRPVLEDGKPKKDDDGNPVVEPDPAYFQSRPSAAGTGYDPLSTSASNLGPENKDLIAAIKERRAAAAKLDGVAPSQVPPDALLASGSGLDPHISPAYASSRSHASPANAAWQGRSAPWSTSTPRVGSSGSSASRGSTSSSSTSLWTRPAG